MRLSQLTAVTFFGSLLLINSGCGQNLGNAFGTATSSQSSNNSGSGTGPVTKTNLWAGVPTVGIASNILTGTQPVFTIDTVNNLLILNIPITGMPFGTGNAPITQLPGATVAFTLSGINITIPLKYLVKGVSFSSPTMLPNGNPLPGIPGGELPHLAATIQNPDFSMEIYGSVKYFATFVPVPQINKYLSYINVIGGQLTIPIMSQDNTETLGYFSIIAPTGNFDGGFYISIVFPPEMAAVLDDLFS